MDVDGEGFLAFPGFLADLTIVPVVVLGNE